MNRDQVSFILVILAILCISVGARAAESPFEEEPVLTPDGRNLILYSEATVLNASNDANYVEAVRLCKMSVESAEGLGTYYIPSCVKQLGLPLLQSQDNRMPASADSAKSRAQVAAQAYWPQIRHANEN